MMITGELNERDQDQKRRLRLLIASTFLLFVVAALLVILQFYAVAAVIFLLALSTAGYSFYLMVNEINRARKSLRQITGTTRDQGNVISFFSHRIREPLNNLVIACELLSDSDPDEKQKDLIDTLIASTNNMVSTVNELTMQSAGTMTFEKRKMIRFNLLSAIQNTVELFNLKGTGGVDFSIKSDDENGPELIGDPIIIKQIILDIINNIPEGISGQRRRLDISVGQPFSEGKGVVAPITLNFSGSISDKDDDNGQPPLSVRLITSNGGRYRSQSSGDESTMTIEMPFDLAERITDTGDVASPKIVKLIKEEKRKRDLKELNLLLVEDNLINQKITFLTLKPLVKSIDTASNGKEALDKIATSDYDIILMDIQMPVMDGLIATGKIRALEKSTNKHVPIIAITANAMLGDKEKCLSAGMDDYISKPFHPASLIEKIRKFF